MANAISHLTPPGQHVACVRASL